MRIIIALILIPLSLRILQKEHTNKEIQQEERPQHNKHDVEVDVAGITLVPGASVRLRGIY